MTEASELTELIGLLKAAGVTSIGGAIGLGTLLWRMGSRAGALTQTVKSMSGTIGRIDKRQAEHSQILARHGESIARIEGAA